jgi:hypothetical protein
MAVSMSMRNM